MPSLAYRVECTRRTLATRHHLSEWHTSLASALAAMQDHHQRPWSTVALVPQVDRPPYQEQLGFALKETV